MPDVDPEETLNFKKKQLTAVTDISNTFIQNPPQIKQVPHTAKSLVTGTLFNQAPNQKQATLAEYRQQIEHQKLMLRQLTTKP